MERLEGNGSATEAALRFVISCPQISVALNGFTNKEHIDMECRIADETEPMSDQELERIKKMVSQSMNEACTGCGYCDKCPKGIPIPSFMQLYNEKHVFHKSDDQMKNILNDSFVWGILVGKKGLENECIECGLCERECTQHLPIIKRLKEISVWSKNQES